MAQEVMRNMAGLIRVTPEELRAMAKQYGVESQEVLNQVDRLNRMISDLKSMWKVLQAKRSQINTSSSNLHLSKCQICFKM